MTTKLVVEQGRATCGEVIYMARQSAFPGFYYITSGYEDPRTRGIVAADIQADSEQAALERWAATAEVGA